VTASSADPRLMGDEPGLAGLWHGFRRRLTQGELGFLPVILGLGGVWIYFGQANSKFLSSENLSNLTLQIASTGTIALGVVLVLLLGEIDLSLGAVSGIAAATMTVLNTRHGWDPTTAIVAALAVGAFAGLVQGLWVTKFRVPAFVVTLAGQLVGVGVLLRVLGRQGSINITDNGILRLANTFYGTAVAWTFAALIVILYAAALLWTRRQRTQAGLRLESTARMVIRVGWLAVGTVLATIIFTQDRGLPLTVVVFVGLVVIFDIVLRRTRFGRHVFAVGGSAEAARRAGIRVDRVRVIVFVLAGTLAAAGGVLAASRLSAVTQSSGGNELLLNAIAMAVIGGTSLFGGRGSAWSALLGALVIGSIANGMVLLNKTSDVRFIVTGIALVAAASIDAVSRRGRASSGRA
jgi:D-xylose transport system permease protein